MNEKDIKKLMVKGKIRSYNVCKKPKKYSAKRTKNIPAPKSQALTWVERELKAWCDQRNFELAREYRFHPVRRFRYDFAIVNLKLAIEFEGGIFLKKSGHNTATHYTKDATKYNLSTVMGWKVLRYTALNYKQVINDLNELVK